MKPASLVPIAGAAMLAGAPAVATPKQNVDAVADTDYRRDLRPMKKKQGTRVLIDRF